jgi:hypothetical protein
MSLFRCIATYLEICEVGLLRSTSKISRQLNREVTLYDIIRGRGCVRRIDEYACRVGSLDIVMWLSELKHHSTTTLAETHHAYSVSAIALTAAEYGHKHILEYIMNRYNYDLKDIYIVAFALRSGHVELVRWLVSVVHCDLSPLSICCMENGKTRILRLSRTPTAATPTEVTYIYGSVSNVYGYGGVSATKSSPRLMCIVDADKPWYNDMIRLLESYGYIVK